MVVNIIHMVLNMMQMVVNMMHMDLNRRLGIVVGTTLMGIGCEGGQRSKGWRRQAIAG